MIGRASLGAALVTILLAFVARPAAAAIPQALSALPRGGSYVLDPDPTVGTAAIGLWFRAPGAGYDNATPGISNLAATAAAVVPLASGRSLYAMVHTAGGQLNIEVYPDIVGIGAVVPASAARRIVAAMTAAYFSSNVDENAVKTARANAAVLGVQQRYEADTTLHDLLFAQIFLNGPAHYPPLPDTVSALTSISASQVGAFAKRAFRAENAVLTLTGNIDASSIAAVTDGNGAGAMDPPYDSPLAQIPSTATKTGAVDGVGLAWLGPPISDEKAATALDFVADYLFRDQTGLVSKSLDRSRSDAMVVGQFITLHDPGVMVVTIGGNHEKQAEQQVLDALGTLQQPLDRATFDAAREAFLYHVASDTQTPQEQADNLGWYSVEGNLPYAPGTAAGAYEQQARGLDPQYVADVVRRYLGKPVVVDLIASSPQPGSAP
ncbi:MAG: insulinase family protein [Candidatus Eremiobacteraeota bacterium]|nr:insulinase family protein [Candidatus Eremiobacteraeota bacterium]